MENSKNERRDIKKKTRPTQRLYIPPAQRSKNKTTKNCLQTSMDSLKDTTSSDTELSIESDTNCSREISSTNIDEQSLVIMLDNIKCEKNVDVDKEEMERAIANINRKTRPLIKHVNVGNKDVLHINIDDKDVKQKKSVNRPKNVDAIIDEQVANWEDLFNEADEICGEITEQIRDYISETDKQREDSSEDYEYPEKNTGPNDLDHVLELYDFPSSLKTQDLIQLYSEVNNELMYIKWCDETHALLVLSSPNQAKRALHVHHGIIKARTMNDASSVAIQVASRVDLKPAMKRPQTNMQTARRLITTHLGTKSKLSKEEYAREREELRKAKELKQALKQSENDAWNGNPRPSTA